jgi:hypothetical protein
VFITMGFSFVGFCTGVSAAIVIKLTCSLNDVLWLSAFLTPNLSHKQRTENALTYSFICLLQTCLAFFIFTFGQEVMESLLGKNDDRMSADRILTLISGSALLVYSIVLAKEYYDENDGQNTENDAGYSLLENTSHGSDSSAEKPGQRKEEIKEDDNDDKCNPQDVEVGNMFLPLEIEYGTDSDSSDKNMTEQVEDESPGSGKESRSLAVISLLGSLDDLALMVSMLVGKSFGVVELILGAMIATVAIVFICLFLTKCKLIADVLEKIPLVAIVTGFCVVLLTKGIFFMD